MCRHVLHLDHTDHIERISLPRLTWTRSEAMKTALPNTSDRNEGYTRRVYVVAEENESKSVEMQWRIASWNSGMELTGLQGADHMPMFSKPRELSQLLMEIANIDKHCLLIELNMCLYISKGRGC